MVAMWTNPWTKSTRRRAREARDRSPQRSDGPAGGHRLLDGLGSLGRPGRRRPNGRQRRSPRRRRRHRPRCTDLPAAAPARRPPARSFRRRSGRRSGPSPVRRGPRGELRVEAGRRHDEVQPGSRRSTANRSARPGARSRPHRRRPRPGSRSPPRPPRSRASAQPACRRSRTGVGGRRALLGRRPPPHPALAEERVRHVARDPEAHPGEPRESARPGRRAHG